MNNTTKSIRNNSFLYKSVIEELAENQIYLVFTGSSGFCDINADEARRILEIGAEAFDAEVNETTVEVLREWKNMEMVEYCWKIGFGGEDDD